jgi:hypothetical protein
MAPRAGLEPATFRLTAERSTIELPGIWYAFNHLQRAHHNTGASVAGIVAGCFSLPASHPLPQVWRILKEDA